MTGLGTTLTLLVGAALLVSSAWRPVRAYLARSPGERDPEDGRPVAEPGPGAEDAAATSDATIRATHGDAVRIHYTGWLSDGSVFDTSHGDDPLEFVIGAGHVIPGMERAVEGMEIGETKVSAVPPEDAYGPTVERYMTEIPRSRLPSGDVQVGDVLEVPGSPIPARVLEFRGDRVLMDVNHPLAGRTLTFEVTLLEIVERGVITRGGPEP